MIKWTRIMYLIGAWLFPGAILVQVFFVGLSLFTGQAYWRTHMVFGHLIGMLPLLLVVLGYLGRLPHAAKRLTWLLFGVYFVQAEIFALIRPAAPMLAALHPVLALVLFAVALTIALRARAFVQAPVRTVTTSEPPVVPIEGWGNPGEEKM